MGGSRHRQGQKSSCPPQEAPPLRSGVRVRASQAFQAPVLQAFSTQKVSPASSFRPSLSGAPRGWGHSPQGAPGQAEQVLGPQSSELPVAHLQLLQVGHQAEDVAVVLSPAALVAGYGGDGPEELGQSL